MAVIVEELRVDNPEGESEGKEGSTFLSVLDPKLRASGRLRITVGMEMRLCLRLAGNSRTGGVVQEG